jgi:hypothetical protein
LTTATVEITPVATPLLKTPIQEKSIRPAPYEKFPISPDIQSGLIFLTTNKRMSRCLFSLGYHFIEWGGALQVKEKRPEIPKFFHPTYQIGICLRDTLFCKQHKANTKNPYLGTNFIDVLRQICRKITNNLFKI